MSQPKAERHFLESYNEAIDRDSRSWLWFLACMLFMGVASIFLVGLLPCMSATEFGLSVRSHPVALWGLVLCSLGLTALCGAQVRRLQNPETTSSKEEGQSRAEETTLGTSELDVPECGFTLEQMRLYYEAYDRCGERSWATDQWVVERFGSLLQSSVRHRVLKDMRMLLLLNEAWPCVSGPDENSDIKFHAYDERGQFVEMTARRPAAHVIALWNIGQRLCPLS